MKPTKLWSPILSNPTRISLYDRSFITLTPTSAYHNWILMEILPRASAVSVIRSGKLKESSHQLRSVLYGHGLVSRPSEIVAIGNLQSWGSARYSYTLGSGWFISLFKATGYFPGSHQHLKQQTSHPRLWRWNLNENGGDGERGWQRNFSGVAISELTSKCLLLEVCVTSTSIIHLSWYWWDVSWCREEMS
jgi:hypothetical protein